MVIPWVANQGTARSKNLTLLTVFSVPANSAYASREYALIAVWTWV